MRAEERKKARRMARKLKAEGYSNNVVSEKLAAEGFYGYDKKPYSTGGISYLIKYENGKASNKRPFKRTGATSGKKVNPSEMGKLEAIVKILKTDMDSEERIALALLVGDA